MNLLPTLLTVISIWGIAVITPGPNFFITVQTTVSHSRLSAIFVVLGICTGTVIWAVAGFFGIAYLFIAVPWIYATLKIVGGSYLIYLGLKFIISAHKSNQKPEIPNNHSDNLLLYWWRGLVTIISNPKTAMFITSLFASVLPKEPSIFVGVLSVFLMTSISFIWYSIVVFFFSSNRFSKFNNRIQNWVQGFAGIVFVIFGTKLVFGNK